MLEKGKNYVLFVPPGWLIIGTIGDITDRWISLSESVYAESVKSDQAMLSLGLADDVRDVVQNSYPLPEGYLIQTDAILMASPCALDITALTRSAEANAIRGSR